MALGARGDVEKPELIVLVIARADRQIRRQGHAFRAALGPDAFFDVSTKTTSNSRPLALWASSTDRVPRSRTGSGYLEIVGAMHIHELEHVGGPAPAGPDHIRGARRERPQGRESSIVRMGVIPPSRPSRNVCKGRASRALFSPF